MEQKNCASSENDFYVITNHETEFYNPVLGITFKDKFLYLTCKEYLQKTKSIFSDNTGGRPSLAQMIDAYFEDEKNFISLSSYRFANFLSAFGKFFLETNLDWPEDYYQRYQDEKTPFSKEYKQPFLPKISFSLDNQLLPAEEFYRKNCEFICLPHLNEKDIFEIPADIMKKISDWGLVIQITQLLMEVKKLFRTKSIDLLLIGNKLKEVEFLYDELSNSTFQHSTSAKEAQWDFYCQTAIFYARNNQADELIEFYLDHFILQSDDQIAFEFADFLKNQTDKFYQEKLFCDKEHVKIFKSQVILLLLVNKKASFTRRLCVHAFNELGNKVWQEHQDDFAAAFGLENGAEIITFAELKQYLKSPQSDGQQTLLNKIKDKKIYLYEQIVLNPRKPQPIQPNPLTHKLNLADFEFYQTQSNVKLKKLLDQLKTESLSFRNSKFNYHLNRASLLFSSALTNQRDLQDNLLKDKIAHKKLNEDCQKASKKTELFNKQLNDINHENSVLEKQIKTNQEKLNYERVQIRQIEQQIETKKTIVEKLKNEIKESDEKKPQLENQLKELQTSNDALKEKIEEETTHNANNRKTLSDIKTQNQLEKEKLKLDAEELVKNQQELTELQNEKRILTEQLNNCIADNERLTISLEAKEQQTIELRSKIIQKNEENSLLQTNLNLEAKLEQAQQKIQKLKKKIDIAKEENKNLSEKNQNIAIEIKAVKDELMEEKEVNQATAKLLEKSREELNKAEQENNKLNAKNKNLVEEQKKADAKLIEENKKVISIEQINTKLTAENEAKQRLEQANTQLQQQNQKLQQDLTNETQAKKRFSQDNEKLTQEVADLKNRPVKNKKKKHKEDDVELLVNIEDKEAPELTNPNNTAITAEMVKNARLNGDDILAALGQIYRSKPDNQAESWKGTWIKKQKARAVLIVENSVGQLNMSEILKLYALVESKHNEDHTNSYRFIRREQDLFRCNYGNTNFWQKVMEAIKARLTTLATEGEFDKLDNPADRYIIPVDNKKSAKTKFCEIMKTHIVHDYGFGFFRPAVITACVKEKIETYEQQQRSQKARYNI